MLSRFTGFIGPSYQSRSVNIDAQRTINLFPELNEIGTGKAGEIAALITTEGLRRLATIGSGPFRGGWVTSSGLLFIVSGNTVYSVSSVFVGASIGTLSTSSGPVSIADSPARIAIVDGSTQGFFYTFQSSTWSAIPFPTDIDFITFAGCDRVTYQDGYFIFDHKGTPNFFITGLYGDISGAGDDSTIDPLDFSAIGGSSDTIVGHLSDHRNIWLFGQKTTEIFYNQGGTTTDSGGNVEALFPFARIEGAYIEYGLAAPFSLAKTSNTIFWLGQNSQGSGIVFMANGYTPQRISTHAVEYAIQGYENISGATAYCYQRDGHEFYVLNFPSAKTTWVFDSATKQWHERAYTNNGSLERHRGECHMFAFGMHLVGDYANGNLYELSQTTYDDDGAPLTRRRRSPHLTKDLARVFYNSFQLDIEAGIGLDGIQQGTDPQVMLRYSDDGGHTWSTELWVSMGKIGHTKHRPLWRRLGQSRDRIFEATVTDPVKVIMIGAQLDLELGAN